MPTWTPNTDCVVNLDNASNVLTDISDAVSTASMDGTASAAVFYTFGLSGGQSAEGNRTVTATLGVRRAEDSGLATRLIDPWFFAAGKMGARTLQIDLPDSSAGSTRISGEFYITAWQPISQDAGGDGTPTVVNLALQSDGLPSYSVL